MSVNELEAEITKYKNYWSATEVTLPMYVKRVTQLEDSLEQLKQLSLIAPASLINDKIQDIIEASRTWS